MVRVWVRVKVRVRVRVRVETLRKIPSNWIGAP